MAGRWENWVHWRELRGACPICGEPAHVGMSERNGKFFWLHDDCPGVPEFYRTHGVWKLEEIPFEEFKRLCEEAKALGLEPRATSGGGSGKRVHCIETGVEYRSIQEAADAIGRSRASLSAAMKRGGTCGGCHWEMA